MRNPNHVSLKIIIRFSWFLSKAFFEDKARNNLFGYKTMKFEQDVLPTAAQWLSFSYHWVFSMLTWSGGSRHCEIYCDMYNNVTIIGYKSDVLWTESICLMKCKDLAMRRLTHARSLILLGYLDRGLMYILCSVDSLWEIKKETFSSFISLHPFPFTGHWKYHDREAAQASGWFRVVIQESEHVMLGYRIDIGRHARRRRAAILGHRHSRSPWWVGLFLFSSKDSFSLPIKVKIIIAPWMPNYALYWGFPFAIMFWDYHLSSIGGLKMGIKMSLSSLFPPCCYYTCLT